jgi:hypothetical protein
VKLDEQIAYGMTHINAIVTHTKFDISKIFQLEGNVFDQFHCEKQRFTEKELANSFPKIDPLYDNDSPLVDQSNILTSLAWLYRDRYAYQKVFGFPHSKY